MLVFSREWSPTRFEVLVASHLGILILASVVRRLQPCMGIRTNDHLHAVVRKRKTRHDLTRLVSCLHASGIDPSSGFVMWVSTEESEPKVVLVSRAIVGIIYYEEPKTRNRGCILTVAPSFLPLLHHVATGLTNHVSGDELKACLVIFDLTSSSLVS